MNENMKLDANEVINNLMLQIAQLAQEKAMLQVQLSAALMQQKKEGGNDDDTT